MGEAQTQTGAMESRLEAMERELLEARREREALLEAVATNRGHLEAQVLERSGLVEGVLAGLEERGVPRGAYLLEVEQARASLAQVDDLLRKIQGVLVRGAGGPLVAIGAAAIAGLSS